MSGRIPGQSLHPHPSGKLQGRSVVETVIELDWLQGNEHGHPRSNDSDEPKQIKIHTDMDLGVK
jgi:hypothetical protein